MKHLLLICVIVSMGLFGCGNDISGTLTMSDITTMDSGVGRFNVVANATYVPVAGKEATGTPIDFTAVYTTASNATPVTRTQKIIIGISGVATYSDQVTQSNETIFLRLTASIGGLSQTKFFTIPPFDTTIHISPSIVSFIQVDPSGGQAPVSVVLTGGYLPYTIVSNDKLTDIEVTFAGSTSLTITKLAASGTNSVSSNATITLKDSHDSLATLRVNYFK